MPALQHSRRYPCPLASPPFKNITQAQDGTLPPGGRRKGTQRRGATNRRAKCSRMNRRTRLQVACSEAGSRVRAVEPAQVRDWNWNHLHPDE